MLEAQAASVGIADLELLHAVEGDERRLEIDAVRREPFVQRVDVFAQEVERDVTTVVGQPGQPVGVGLLEHDPGALHGEHAPGQIAAGIVAVGQGESELIAVERPGALDIGREQQRQGGVHVLLG